MYIFICIILYIYYYIYITIYIWDNESCHLSFSYVNWGMNIQVSWSENQGTQFGPVAIYVSTMLGWKTKYMAFGSEDYRTL